MFIPLRAAEKGVLQLPPCLPPLVRGRFNHPDLWSFWGNRLGDWNKQYRRTGATPLDLALDDYATSWESLASPLRDELRDRAARDVIRRIHLRSADDSRLLGSILSALTADGETHLLPR